MLDSLSILPIKFPIRSPFYTLTGAKDSSIQYVYVNGDATNTVFPTNSSWTYDVHLSVGINTITVQAEDYASNKSDVFIVNIELPEIMPVLSNYYNYLDDKAAEANLTRLPGEKNFYLKTRILDAETNRPNTTYSGLIRAAARELSIPIEDAITLTIVDGITNCFITISDTEILFEADQLFIANEVVIVDPGSGIGELEYIPISLSELRLQTETGRILSSSEFELYDRNYIRLVSPQNVTASYKYFQILPITGTVTALNTALNTTDVVTSTFNSDVTSRPALYILRAFRESITDTYDISISSIALYNLANEIYRDSLLDSFGTYFNTPLEKYAAKTRSKGRIFLQDTVLDKDRLVEIDSREKLETLPSLFDADLRYYIESDPAVSTRYSELDFIYGDGIAPNNTSDLIKIGLDNNQVQSGTGYDMKMVGIV